MNLIEYIAICFNFTKQKGEQLKVTEEQGRERNALKAGFRKKNTADSLQLTNTISVEN